MIKKFCLFGLTFFLLLASCGKKPNISIEGNMHKGAKKMIYLEFLDINQTISLDSIRIKRNNSFKFRFYSENPGIYLLKNDAGKIINLLPFPGEELAVEADYNTFSSGYTVAGSPESEYIRQLVEKLQESRARIKELNDAYQPLSNVTEEQAAAYIKQLKSITKGQRDFSIQFIIEHLSSIASIYALYQEFSEGQYVLGENFDIQYMKIVADSVSKYYPEVPFVKSFVEDARNSEEKFNNLKLLRNKLKEAENQDLNIKLPGISKDTIELASLRGKVVLVYFWSSKSPDSRALNPSLHSIYEKYKNRGFEIFAVAIENNSTEWKNAIRYDELNWINVHELSYPDSRTARLYNVKSLPSSFLYNRNGDIVARNIFGQELEKWLDNIL